MKTRLHAKSVGRYLLTLAAGAALTIGAASAQVNTYTFAPVAGTFTPLATGTAVPDLATDDAVSPTIPIGFSFTYDATVFTQLQASSNGFLTFNTSNIEVAQTNTLATGTAANPSVADRLRPLIAPLWDDISGQVGAALYATTGTAPNRVFTMEWRNFLWDYDATSPVVSFQVKLYETTNVVEFIYRPEGGAVSAPSASILLAGVGTGAGSYLSLNNATATPTASSTVETRTIATVPAAGQIYRFTPPAVICGTPRNIAVSSISNTSATVSFTGGVGNTSYTVVYTPAGGTATTLTPAPTSSPFVLTGLTPSTAYTVSLQPNCSAGVTGNSSTVTFTTGTVAAPANDDPCAAIQLPALSATSVPINATNLGATTTLSTVAPGYTSPPPQGCGVAVNPKDVWFRFTTNASGVGSTNAGIVTTGTAAGSIRVFSATSCSSGFVQVACKGGATNNTNAGSLNVTGLTPSTTYYVAVSPYATSDVQGAFTITVNSLVLAAQQQLAGGEVSVFPNPTTTGQLTVRVTGAGSLAAAQATLFNTLGQAVEQRNLAVRGGVAEQSFSTVGLAKGIYTLRLQAGQQTVIRKVVVE
ncbi:T9SS type A sorting domain-containing protein [Hymenobacter norwichensis]|uniref:T9SS type A sorting domain-containing protein n=1 Tax=Hymenobacter norwichensis TaxID=223903 RepID=UPI0003B485AC|nr:T9SS type A sorting domain-containing protein [Hymenobacter norwichensis]